MTTLEILRRGRALYEANPSHAPVNTVPKGGTVCAAWAILCASYWSGGYSEALCALERAADTDWLADWNAKHSTEEVLAAFDRATAAEEDKAQEFTVEPLPELELVA